MPWSIITIDPDNRMAKSAGCVAVLAIIQNCIDRHRKSIAGHYLSETDRGRHWAALAALTDIASRIKEQTTRYRLLVYGLDDKLALTIPLSDDQATALAAALYLDGVFDVGEHPIPYVHFEACDGD